MGRDSSVYRVAGYWSKDLLSKPNRRLFCKITNTGSGAHPVFYEMRAVSEMKEAWMWK
jgi:hypothetical protein